MRNVDTMSPSPRLNYTFSSIQKILLWTFPLRPSLLLTSEANTDFHLCALLYILKGFDVNEIIHHSCFLQSFCFFFCDVPQAHEGMMQASHLELITQHYLFSAPWPGLSLHMNHCPLLSEASLTNAESSSGLGCKDECTDFMPS